mgnify:CR=1 FL=1
MAKIISGKDLAASLKAEMAAKVAEYPEKYGTEKGKIPYYPILTKQSQELFSKYKIKSQQYGNLFPCGRLADFCYYNMDDAVFRAQEIFDEILTR